MIVAENIIATTKIRIMVPPNYGAIQSVFFFFFDGFLSKIIALPTIAIAIVVALSRS